MTAQLNLIAAALATGLALHAQASVVIDDFSSGAAQFQFGATPAGKLTAGFQAGSMASGVRDWTVRLIGNADRGGRLDIGAEGFNFRTAAGVYHRIDWVYGSPSDPMHLDLAGESHLRFAFADAPLGLNFNVLLYYRDEIDNYSQLGLNIAPHAGAFNVDLAFTDFAAQVQDPSRPADFSYVSRIYLVTQSGVIVNTGGEGFRMTSISAVPEPSSALLVMAAAGAMALCRRPAFGVQTVVEPNAEK